MRALVWHGPNRMSVDELPDPQPGPGEVLLAPEAVGVCGSELEGYLGRQANRTPPLVMGHELAGRVVGAGPGVGEDWIGRRVAVNPLVPPAGAAAGLGHLDPARELIGIHRPGGFAGAVAVPAGQLRALPDGADARLAVLAEPLANGVHASRLGRAGVEGGPAGRVVVLGAGTIGALALQAARVDGAGWIGVLELHPGRREAAGRLGADATFGAPAELREALAPHGGADVVLDAVGVGATRRLALELLRPGGCAVAIGLADEDTPVAYRELVRRGLTLRGSYAYSPGDYDRALELLLAGEVRLGALEEVLPLDAGPAVFAELAAGPSERVKVFLADAAGARAGADGPA
jgi:threonine dehydrogenase-like Zn-dependent dehydrogenase